MLGLPDTDDLGIVSLLLFWGMVELGVGMIAICLPTFRPIFKGWSPESIVRSVRSIISLRSVSSHHSGGSKRSGASRLKNDANGHGSDSSVVAINMDSWTPDPGRTHGNKALA